MTIQSVVVSELDLPERAAEYFQQLRAFDPQQAERSELAAAGVVSHTIDSLFGSEFDGIAQGLSTHFDSLGPEHLLTRTNWAPINETLRDLHRSLGRERLSVSEQAMHTSESSGGLRLLTDHIHHIYAFYAGLDDDRASVKIARAIWHAYWYMTQRPTLKEEIQSKADWTMGWVHETLLTSRS